MTKHQYNILMLAAITAVLGFVLLSGATLQQAFAHASTTLTVSEEPVTGKKIRVTVGHTNEPTYGTKPGVHDGKHNFEVLLADSDTRLPLTGASLKVDKYYFKDIKSFNKAKDLNKADDIEKGIAVGSVFGDPGHYMARQVQKDGIYGYRLYGTVSYFGEATVNIDSTVFCTFAEGDTAKFNSAGWTGSFGCTEDIDDILFPDKNSDVNPRNGGKASFEGAAGDGQVRQVVLDSSGTAQTATLSTVAASPGTVSGAAHGATPLVGFQLLMFGLPAAAVAGLIGFRVVRDRRRDASL